MNPGSLHWECGVLTTAPPGEFLLPAFQKHESMQLHRLVSEATFLLSVHYDRMSVRLGKEQSLVNSDNGDLGSSPRSGLPESSFPITTTKEWHWPRGKDDAVMLTGSEAHVSIEGSPRKIC